MKKIPLLVTALLFLPIQSLLSQEAGQFYAGGSFGLSTSKARLTRSDDSEVTLNDQSPGFKFFGGVSLGEVLGIEGSVRKLTEIDGVVQEMEFSAKASGFDLETFIKLPIDDFELFGKGGLFFWSDETTIDDEINERSGTDLIWGLGLNVFVKSFMFRVEWETLEVTDTRDFSFWTVGTGIRF